MLGGGAQHQPNLLQSADHRSCEVKVVTSELQGELQQVVPYLATVSDWTTVMQYLWYHQDHINVLELEAFVLNLKKRCP